MTLELSDQLFADIMLLRSFLRMGNLHSNEAGYCFSHATGFPVTIVDKKFEINVRLHVK